MMKRLLVACAACAGFAAPAFAQFAPPEPTEEDIARWHEEDQLSLEQCGVPRNAGDDYRPEPMFSDQTRAPRIETEQAYVVEEVASGIAHGWGLAFLPSGNMLVTIRNQGLVTVSAEGEVSDLLPGVPEIRTSFPFFGMHDVILDQDFETNRTIYLAYNTQPEGADGDAGHVASARVSEDESEITDLTVLWSAPTTRVRRVVQADDGTLFIVTADLSDGYGLTQSAANPDGKILRINTDGSIPEDNPFVDDPDADPSVYALGMRDPQGMAIQPGTGALWVIENEPRGGDELNLIQAGLNYGFPLISYGRDNDGSLLNDGLTAMEGMEQPVHFWTPSVAFAGMAFYTGEAFPEWQGDVFMGGLSGLQLVRIVLNEEGRVVAEEKLLRDRCARIRDVRMGPDGNLYVVTDADEGHILRIRPE
ncbi:MAG: PQQ-dependent sugar dehydrogenase [Maricaulaceae bacterium]|jgi:glucose/arabinose dehydrogenase